MADLLDGRREADRDRGARAPCLCPGQELPIGPIPVSLPVRVGLEYPAHPPLPHRCLPPRTPPAAKGKRRNLPDPVDKAVATSSAGAAQTGSGKICHLRSDHLGPVAPRIELDDLLA